MEINDKISNEEDLVFQVTDWGTTHEDIEFGDETLKKYVIRLYGTTPDQKKVYVKVKNFTPYFYVALPPVWGTSVQQKAQILVNEIKDRVSKKNPEFVNSLKSWDVVNKCIFWSFTNYKKFPFLRLVFHSHEGFRAFERILNTNIYNPLLQKKSYKYKLYETNIEPMFRCMHMRKINSFGWIRIKGNKYNHFNKSPSHNDMSVYTDWSNLDPAQDKGTEISPIIIAAFDIECTSGDGSFPQPNRDEDKVIQIGTTFSRYGESECFYKHIITLGSCDKIEGADVESYDNEVAVLLAWTKLIQRMNPDVMTGYNIFGFDYKYLEERSKKLGCNKSFTKLGRIIGENCPFVDKTLASSALGKNELKYYAMQGRIQIDIMKVVQRDYKLGSYKLDSVASEFIREAVKSIDICKKTKTCTVYTKGLYGLEIGRYIKLFHNDGLSDTFYNNEEKFEVIDIKMNCKEGLDGIVIKGFINVADLGLDKYKVSWCQAKDDVSPQDIFKMQKGTSKDRQKVAVYCLQDSSLCNKLMNKLQILTNNIGMANVCHVPLSYIFLRGQGVKIFSLVSKKCRERDHLIPVIRKPYNNDKDKDMKFKKKEKEESDNIEDDEGYEGATVFEPEVGAHFEPVSVLDYNSLYPNSMRHKNMSHETLVDDPKYDNLPNYYYEKSEYLTKTGEIKSCKFARAKDGSVGILPEILTELLDARADTRRQQANEKNPFKWKILEGLQLAYKVTANSLYGQCGAPTSPIYKKDIAASTTSTGREMLNASRILVEVILPVLAKSAMKNNYDTFYKCIDLLFQKKVEELIGEKNVDILKTIQNSEDCPRYKYLDVFTKNRTVIDDKKFIDKKLGHECKNDFVKWIYDKFRSLLEGKEISPKIIYGDTDSVFIKFGIAKKKEFLKDQASLNISIELAILCSKLLAKILPVPHNMEYEKTFHPFIILTKKKYVGNKYESDPNKFYQASMGIVLKRRDNSPIVKIVVGGIIKSILNDKSVDGALAFTKKVLSDILSDRYALDKFIVTKTIRGNGLTADERKIEELKPKEERAYANRNTIVHAVLADRIADRDPGNKPMSNDRIPYAYVIVDHEVELQGERVETPDYIIENKLKLDYLFYITNQIMKPSIQFLQHLTDSPKKIFEDCIIKETNRRTGKKPLNYYFKMIGETDFDDDPFGNNSNSNSNDSDDDNSVNFEDTEDYEDYDNNKKNKKKQIPINKKGFSCYDDKKGKDEIQEIKPKKNISKKKKQVSKSKSVYDNKKGGFILDL